MAPIAIANSAIERDDRNVSQFSFDHVPNKRRSLHSSSVETEPCADRFPNESKTESLGEVLNVARPSVLFGNNQPTCKANSGRKQQGNGRTGRVPAQGEPILSGNPAPTRSPRRDQLG